MRLHCPNCNQALKAEHINIQRMMALCDACSGVFELDGLRPKAKRRKVQRPQHLRLLKQEPLHLAFRTNFRLEKNESFGSSAVAAGFFSMLTLLMAGLYLEGEVPIILPLVFLLMTSAALYFLATIAYNKTHIRLRDDAIAISRRPLPALTQARQVSLDGVQSFSAEETAASQREGYDTPRYHVWARRADGSRALVSGDLVEDYASYIASQLNQRLVDADYEAADDADSAARLRENAPAESAARQDIGDAASERESAAS